ncbi:MAG: hypothetical protein AAFY03_10730 [Pseudomonadota bacterium]
MTSAAVILLTGFTPNPAIVAAWDAFRTRCLEPQENVVLAQPTDLEPHQSFKNDGDTYSTYLVGTASAVLEVSDGRGGLPQWCSLHWPTRDPESFELGGYFLDWADEAAKDRYDVIERPGDAMVLRSTNWREPKLDVSLRTLPGEDGIVLEARETDLEG